MGKITMENLGVKRGRYENIWEFYSQPRSFQGLLHFWANLCNAWYWNVGYTYIYIYIPPMDDLRCQYPFFPFACLNWFKTSMLWYICITGRNPTVSAYTRFTPPKKLTESNGDMRQHDITPESLGLWSIRRSSISMSCIWPRICQWRFHGDLMMI